MTSSSFWSSGALHQVRALIRPRRYRFAFSLLLLLANRLTTLVLPAAMMYVVDHALVERRADQLNTVAVVIGLAAVFQASSTFVLARIMAVSAQQATAELRRRVQAHVMRLPVRFFDRTQSGAVVSRIMADTEYVRDLIGSGLIHFAGSTVTSVSALAYLFYLNPSLTAVLLSVVTVFGAAIAWSFHRLRPMYAIGAGLRAGLFARLSESLSGIRVVKTYTAEKHEERVFTGGVHALFRNQAASHMWWSANSALLTLAIGAVAVVMVLVGGPTILGGGMSLGQFVSYILFLALVFGPLEHVVWMGPQVGEALAALERIHDLLEEPAETADDEARMPFGPLIGSVRFENVSFAYEAGIDALSGVSVDVTPGSTVALVGASGAGKSTFINLAMAFARPSSGRILVDGHNLSTVRLRDYRRQLGVVLQDNFLFDGTVADNLRYGCLDASEERVRRASQIAHADEFIRRLPHQYETIVGERGVKLSGGQRQRVAIARAILADPRILVLDEATSSLDSETEALIQDGLRALRRGRTTFVIAHRLSTVRSADLILVLDRGRIVERGTHDSLMALGGAYRAFYDRQHAVHAERLVNAGEEMVPEA